jgi:hypothetical protein
MYNKVAMPKSIKMYRLFLASPSDVQEEHALVANIISDWNNQIGHGKGAIIELVSWGTHAYPSVISRPQEIINRQVLDSADIVVGIFWSRFGLPTGEAESGTEEEIRRSMSSGKSVMVYFADKPIPPSKFDPDQYTKINKFKDEFKNQGLYWIYSDLEVFSNDFRRHLAATLEELLREDHQDRLDHNKKESIIGHRDEHLSLSSSTHLSLTGFAYPKPDWLTEDIEASINDIAKAAFVLLAFDRTYSGAWGKTYLYRLKTSNKKLPLVRGSLTGTPFALIALASYAKQSESTIANWASNHLLETLNRFLTDSGQYLHDDERIGQMPGPEFEPIHHLAGGCLTNLLLTNLAGQEKTLEFLCETPALLPYAQATVSRTLLQASILYPGDSKIRRRLMSKYRKNLEALISSGNSAVTPSRIWAHSYGYHVETFNQWGALWWILPSITLQDTPLKLRQALDSISRRFLLTQSAAEATGFSLLPNKLDNLGQGLGKQVFGTSMALVSWRTLELYGPRSTPHDKEQPQRMLNRIINSAPEIIESPCFHTDEEPESLEGYLAWAGLCLVAASLGIHNTPEDCQKALSLVEELTNATKDELSPEQLQEFYQGVINGNGLFTNLTALSVAKAATRVTMLYKVVLQEDCT